MQKWEYQTIMINRKRKGWSSMTDWDTKIDLPLLGDDGWELVSVIPVADADLDYTGMTNHLVYIFKRPKE